MRLSLAGALVILVLATGCGSGLAGTYHADVRAREGEEPSQTPGYTLEELQARVKREQRRLILENGGRFIWHNGPGVIEGSWKAQGQTVFLMEELGNGEPIHPKLRVEMQWRLGPNGEIVNTDSYGAYGVEEFYTRSR